MVHDASFVVRSDGGHVIVAQEALSKQEKRELVERLADFARSGVPLPAGLRAAAAEAGSLRLSRQMRNLAKQLEAGVKWDDKPGAENQRLGVDLPSHVLGVAKAGASAGNLAEALDALVDQYRVYREVKSHLFSSLLYPAVLLVCTLIFLLAALLLVVRPMKDIFADFGTELPPVTQLCIQLANHLPSIMMWTVIGAAILLLAIRLLGGPVGWNRFLGGIPIVGPMFHFAGVAQMLRLLRVLLAHEVPLPEALRLTSTGTASANMRLVADWLAEQTAAGHSLSALMASTPRIPASILPIVEWGEKNQSLAEAVKIAHEMLEGRICMRGDVLSVMAGPLMFIVIGTLCLTLVIGMFMPLVSLIQNLT